ncbi:MAG: GTPase HflX [Variibacter sp.]
MEPRDRKKRPDRPEAPAVEPGSGRAVVIGAYLRERAGGRLKAHAASTAERPVEARIEEAKALATAIDLEVVEAGVVMLSAITPATYIGKGKVEEIAGLIRGSEAELVIMDCALSPVQQRNLEKAWSAKVLDRTGLILEIFGRRARTREGTLQVEHAHLTYQKSRLVRSWTHLERQRGGFGFLGGPGETQIEADRRVIETRLARIERDLETVKRTRKLHRDARQRVPYPIVALVGYTNAGKSTLFNRLTGGSVLEADMLFATLDPTLRTVQLPHGAKVILSDTVGFISDLPTTLIAAFRATLEEVVEADVILHVRDIAHADSDVQAQDVAHVLSELGVNPDDDTRLIELWNKVDALDAEARERVANAAERIAPARRPVLVSALTGEGLDKVAEAIEERLSHKRETLTLVVPASDGAGLAWLHRNADVLEKVARSDGSTAVTIRADRAKAEVARKRFGQSIA